MAVTRLAASLFLALAGAAAAAEPAKVVVSAGPKGDPVLAFAQQLCALVQQQQRRHGIACEAKESGGGIDNLQALDGSDVHVAFARADWIDQAVTGTGSFRDRGPVRGSGAQRSGGPNPELRALFALQTETLILLARADAGVKAATDLAGKRVNIGPPGSGPRAMFDLVAPALGWSVRDFAVAAELKAADQVDALCRGRVDAVLYLGASPDAPARATAQTCDVAVVPIAGREVEALGKEKPFLVRAPVPGGVYKGAPRDVPSVGFAVVAASSSKVDPRIVYEIVKTVFDNLGRLQRADPVFARLDARRMAGEGLAAPLHDGAARLYKERGWIR
jgi:TRAP transporter TAXI family solute receptor